MKDSLVIAGFISLVVITVGIVSFAQYTVKENATPDPEPGDLPE